MQYRVFVRSWVVRDEVFFDRNSAELFRLKLAASRPTLPLNDVAVVAEVSTDGSATDVVPARSGRPRPTLPL